MPLVKSSGCDAAALLRSIDFGVKTMSGRCSLSSACRRSRWKYDAGRRGLGDRHRVIGAQRQEALDAGRGVVGTLTFVAVRQQQDDARLLAPLGLARGDVLVDDGLGAVDEVAELRLPERQRLGAGHRVAVLEAERGVLAQQRVVDVERGLLVADVGQRRPLVGVGAIDDRREPRGERATTGVLAGDAHRTTVQQQRAHREDLAGAPVDRAGRDGLRTALQLRQHLRVDGEAFGHVGVRVGDRLHASRA